MRYVPLSFPFCRFVTSLENGSRLPQEDAAADWRAGAPDPLPNVSHLFVCHLHDFYHLLFLLK